MINNYSMQCWIEDALDEHNKKYPSPDQIPESEKVINWREQIRELAYLGYFDDDDNFIEDFKPTENYEAKYIS